MCISRSAALLATRFYSTAVGSIAAASNAISRCEIQANRLDNEAKSNRMNQLNIENLFDVWRSADSSSREFQTCLRVLNLFYNYGRSLSHSQTATRLLAVCMHCKEYRNAVDVIKLYNTWLKVPPKNAAIFAVMNVLYTKKMYIEIREVMVAVRENWQISLESRSYVIAIAAALQLPTNPLQEAMIIYRDAEEHHMELPLHCHIQLLQFALSTLHNLVLPSSSQEVASTSDVDASTKSIINICIELKDRLLRECYAPSKQHQLPSSVWLSLSWMHWLMSHSNTMGDSDVQHSNEVWGYDAMMNWRSLLQQACVTQTLPNSHAGYMHLPKKFIDALKQQQEENKEVLMWLRISYGVYTASS